MAITKEGFQTLKPPVKEIDIPDSNGLTTFIRMFTVGQREEVMEYLNRENNLDNLLSILTLSLCDADGNLFFEPDEKADLQGLTLDATKKMVVAVLDFNRLSKDAEEDLVKNSEAAQSGETSLPLPENSENSPGSLNTD